MSAPVHLRAQVALRQGEFQLDVDVQVPAGQVLAVVGPNGSGKSTLLHLLAGLLRPHRGSVRLGPRTLTDAGTLVPAQERRIGLLSQDPALFPHLSVLENVAFGPRSTGQRPRPARARAEHWLDRVGMSEYARHRPGRLSGGQQQRVAIARALAAEPEVLLLDEPLAALDVQTAPQIRQLLAEQVRASGTTTVLVSHDVLDAVVLAHRIAVLHEGRVAEHGPVAEVLAAPRSPFAATLAGVNLLPGELRTGNRVRTVLGEWQLGESGASDAEPGAGGTHPGDSGSAPGADGTRAGVRPGQACVLRIRPSAVEIHAVNPGGVNVARTTVRWVEPADGGVRLRLSGSPELVADVPAAQVDPEWLRPGAQVWLRVDPRDTHTGAAADQVADGAPDQPGAPSGAG